MEKAPRKPQAKMTTTLLFTLVLFGTNAEASPVPRERCCISEPFQYLLEKDPVKVGKRFELYKKLGVDIIRIHVFADSEDPAAIYGQILKDYTFHFKAILLNFPGEAGYQLTDQNGALSKQA
jgi:hypothetical protein